MSHTSSSSFSVRKALASAMCPLWIGSKEPPKMPTDNPPSSLEGIEIRGDSFREEGELGVCWVF